MINTQINLLLTNHILQNLLSLTLTQLQPPTQRRNFNIPEVLGSHNNIVLQNSSLNIIQVVIKQYFLVPLQRTTEDINFLLLNELVVVNLGQNVVIFNVLSSFILDELTA